VQPGVTRIATCNHIRYTACSADQGISTQRLGTLLQHTQAGIQAKHADRLRLILGRLNVATGPGDMNLPGLGLHELKGARAGTWAVKVSGNWRVTFVVADKDIDRVDYEDYH
jgi:toxin HigB-1